MLENIVTPEVLSLLPHCKESDIIELVRHRLSAEQFSKNFRLKHLDWKGDNVIASRETSLLLEFRTMKDRFPDKYRSASYRLLIFLGLKAETMFQDPIRIELQQLKTLNNISSLIVWTLEPIATDAAQILRAQEIDVIQFLPSEIEKARSISSFAPIKNEQMDYSIAANLTADLLINRLKKITHRVLSEIAAPIYDSEYGKNRHATDEIMKFETELIDQIVDTLCKSRQNKRAIDAGCGTGRHALDLARHFERIDAFDFSPGMIREAEDTKFERDNRNTHFSVADIEYQPISEEHKFIQNEIGTINLVVAGFGMGSFVEDTSELMRRFYRWLAPGGMLVISFYNSKCLTTSVVPNWRDTALSAHIDAENNTLRVELDEYSIFHIYCKPYTEKVRKEIESVFDIEKVVTFPTTMSLLPNDLLGNETARSLFGQVDRWLSDHNDFDLGHYVLVVAKKPAPKIDAFNRILKILKDVPEEKFEILKHEPVRNMSEAARVIGGGRKLLVKTVVLNNKDDGSLLIVAIKAEKRVNIAKLAKQIGVARNRLNYAAEKDVAKLGFPIGAFSPLGIPSKVLHTVAVDADLVKKTHSWLFLGVGDVERTLKIKGRVFFQVLGEFTPVQI